MTIVKGDYSWRAPLIVCLLYTFSGAGTAMMLEAVISTTKLGFNPFGYWGAVIEISHHKNFAKCYVLAMTAILPLALLSFCIFAPLKIKKNASNPVGSLILGFVFFGLMFTPYMVHTLYFASPHFSSATRLGRMAIGMADSDLVLELSGGLLFISLMLSIWISYFAIPVCFLRIVRSSRSDK